MAWRYRSRAFSSSWIFSAAVMVRFSGVLESGKPLGANTSRSVLCALRDAYTPSPTFSRSSLGRMYWPRLANGADGNSTPPPKTTSTVRISPSWSIINSILSPGCLYSVGRTAWYTERMLTPSAARILAPTRIPDFSAGLPSCTRETTMPSGLPSRTIPTMGRRRFRMTTDSRFSTFSAVRTSRWT